MLVGLLLFTFATSYYFYTLPSIPSLVTLIIKCLPIFCLAGAIYIEESRSFRSGFNRLIFYGLLSSSIGDAFLVYKDLFPLGMVAFAIAHCFYINAFGFRPVKLWIGALLYGIALIMLTQILPNIRETVIFFGIPVYSIFLTTMSWRAIARATAGPDPWSWSKSFCALGSVLFVISDTLICFHDLQKPIPYGRVLIMSTYYIAQLGIALSIKSTAAEVSRDKRK